MTTTNDTIAIRLGHTTIVAPADLVTLAGWLIRDGQAIDDSKNGYRNRRLARALDDLDYGGMERVTGANAQRLLLRVLTLGEVESSERRAEAARLEVAHCEAVAALDRRRAAEMAMAQGK